MNPISTIKSYLDKNLELSKKAHMCFTTISLNGFPNSRFVDLKEVTDLSLTFGSSTTSYKAQEIQENNKVSACIW